MHRPRRKGRSWRIGSNLTWDWPGPPTCGSQNTNGAPSTELTSTFNFAGGALKQSSSAALRPISELNLPRAQHMNTDMLPFRSEEHTSELQSLMRISYAVFCLKKKKTRHH